jgi:hypothetical protein
MEENKLRILEERLLRKVFGFQRDFVTGKS